MKPDPVVAGSGFMRIGFRAMRDARTTLIAAVSVAGLVGAGLGLLAWRSVQKTALRETLRIGYAVEAPYSFVREDGEVSGEGPEIARVVAGRLGIKKLEWRQVDFSSMTQELHDGTIDVIAAGMFITPERSKVVAFSRPTFRVRHGLLVRKGNPSRIQAHADLARSDLRVAVLAGSVEERLFREVVRLDGRRLLAFPDAKSGVRAVQEGVVDALALSAPTLRWALAQMKDPRVELICPDEAHAAPGMSSEGAFAFRPAERDLREAWDAELGRFLGSAEHLALVQAFGFGEDDLPVKNRQQNAVAK